MFRKPCLDRVAVEAVSRTDRSVKGLKLGTGAPMIAERLGGSLDFIVGEHRASYLADDDLRMRAYLTQELQHGRLLHRNASGGRRKIRARQMKEHRTAAPDNPGLRVVIDLDDEIVEMIVAPQSITAVIMAERARPVVVAAGRVFTPGVPGADGANRQKGVRSRRTVGAPPQSQWPESPLWGSAVALALVGDDSTPPHGDRDGVRAGGEPAPARVTGRGPDPDRFQRPITLYFPVSV